MKVLIFGGRDFVLVRRAWAYLDALHEATPFSLVITGTDPDNPRGADGMADRWAKTRGIDRVLFPANWIGRGKPAGPFRNGLMRDFCQPDLGIGFPGAAGTADMARKLEAAGIPVKRPSPAQASGSRKTESERG